METNQGRLGTGPQRHSKKIDEIEHRSKLTPLQRMREEWQKVLDEENNKPH